LLQLWGLWQCLQNKSFGAGLDGRLFCGCHCLNFDTRHSLGSLALSVFCVKYLNAIALGDDGTAALAFGGRAFVAGAEG